MFGAVIDLIRNLIEFRMLIEHSKPHPCHHQMGNRSVDIFCGHQALVIGAHHMEIHGAAV